MYFMNQVRSVRDRFYDIFNSTTPAIDLSQSIIGATNKRFAIILYDKKFNIDYLHQLESILPKFGFDYLVDHDLNDNKIMNIRKKLQEIENINWSKMDSILIFMLCHRDTSNNRNANNKLFNLSKFINEFNPELFREMRDKTKLFSIYRCCSEHLDEKNDLVSSYVIEKTVIYDNFLLIFGQSALSDFDNGNHFIYQFIQNCNQFLQDDKTTMLDITKIFENINNNLKREKIGQKLVIYTSLKNRYNLNKEHLDLSWKFSTSKRIAILLNHKIFDANYPDRSVTDYDKNSLVSILTDLEFGCIFYDDYTVDQIMNIPNILQNHTQIDWSNMDSMLVFILSYGDLNTYTKAYDKSYDVLNFIDKFHTQFTKMPDKPKLFFRPMVVSQKTEIRELSDDLILIYQTTKKPFTKWFQNPEDGTLFIKDFVEISKKYLQDVKLNQLDIIDFYQILINNVFQQTANNSDAEGNQYFELFSILKRKLFPEEYLNIASCNSLICKRPAIILKHKQFKDGPNYIKKLKSILPDFGFDCKVFEISTIEDTMRLLHQENINWKRIDSILFIILTSITFDLSNFIRQFHPKQFSDMCGITKVFLIENQDFEIQGSAVYEDLVLIYGHSTNEPAGEPYIIQKFINTMQNLDTNQIEVLKLIQIMKKNLQNPEQLIKMVNCKTEPYYFKKYETVLLGSEDKQIAIILNNIEFKNLPYREGSDHDVNQLKSCLPKLGFGYIFYDDLLVHQITNLRQILLNNDKIDWEKMESILFILLSHGSPTEINAFDGSYQLSKFMNQFNPNEFPEMRDKCKLFFISACRGDGEVITQSVSNIQHDGPNRTGSIPIRLEKCSLYKDAVIIYGTTDKKRSIRDPNSGTYFIQELIQTINNLGENRLEISEMFTILNRNLINRTIMGEDDKILKQIAEMVSTLTKPIYFRKI